MSRTYVTTVSIILGLSLACVAECGCTKAFAAPAHLDGKVSKDQLADALSRAGMQCVWQQGAKSELLIDTVRMGSAAYYQGLCPNDNIRSITASNGVLKIMVKRGAATYQAQLPLEPESGLNGSFDLSAAVSKGSLKASATGSGAELKTQKAGLDQNTPKIVNVNVPVRPIVDIGQQEVPIVDIHSDPKIVDVMQRLVQYNIELIIDRTGSMSLIDGTDGLTKMEWCHRQVRDLAERLRPYQKNITITTFNTTFQTYEDCNLERVEQIYGETTPSGSTDLVDPLMSRLDAASAIWHEGAKRTLVVVIHDGLPNVPRDTTVVDQKIIEYTKHMRSPDEVVLTFLQIGATFDGRAFCDRLDTALVGKGAKYDIVNTVTFPQLKQEGLVSAMLNAILANKQVLN